MPTAAIRRWKFDNGFASQDLPLDEFDNAEFRGAGQPTSDPLSRLTSGRFRVARATVKFLLWRPPPSPPMEQRPEEATSRRTVLKELAGNCLAYFPKQGRVIVIQMHAVRKLFVRMDVISEVAEYDRHFLCGNTDPS